MPVPLIAAGALLNTAGTILTDIPVIGGLLNQHPDDPKRLAKNTEWYQAALNGDGGALTALLVASGQYGAAEWNRLHPGLPQVNGAQSAWATDGPRQDAWAKYQQAVAGGAGTALRGAPATPGGTPTLSLSALGASTGGLSPLVLILGALVAFLVLSRLKSS